MLDDLLLEEVTVLLYLQYYMHDALALVSAYLPISTV
jgi:hypothetical protein